MALLVSVFSSCHFYILKLEKGVLKILDALKKAKKASLLKLKPLIYISLAGGFHSEKQLIKTIMLSQNDQQQQVKISRHPELSMPTC